MVNRQQLNQLGIKIGVEEVLVKNIVGHTPPTLYGNAFEAVVGAIFLDKRYERTKKIIIENVFGVFLKIDDIINEDTNYKSQLIEYCQKRKIKLEFPCEVKKSESGNTIYYLTVQMDGESVASASHPNKKQAEQLACKSAIHFRES